jgi:GTPase SAR1 family protein
VSDSRGIEIGDPGEPLRDSGTDCSFFSGISTANARENLLLVLSRLEGIAKHQEAQAVGRGIALLRQKVEQNRFYLTVVGQFKRGKTSFLNALLGAEVLPVAILPLTSVVTMLRYGHRPGAEAVFASGVRKDIEIAALPDYVTEKGNPKNVKGVSHVEVAYPSEYLRRGVVLVDTPGIGSVYSHNTQITYDFLPQVDAAIFVTSPESPLTSTEIEFLSDLVRHVQRVFVVLNKTDQVNDKQLGEVLDFMRHSLPGDVAPTPDSWFAVSAIRALAAKRHNDAEQLTKSGFAALETTLSEFLSSEKNAVFYSSIARSTRKLIADLRLLFELQLRAAQMPVEELRAKLTELDRQLSSAEQERVDSEVLLANSAAQLSRLFETEAKRFAGDVMEPLHREIRDKLRSLTGLSRKEQAATMDRFLKERIERVFEDWRTQFEKSAIEQFRQATDRFAKRVNELICGVRKTAGSLFGFSVESFDATEELVELEPCGYLTDPVLDWGLGNAPLLLPPGLFTRYLRKTMQRKVEIELDRNATRVAFDYKRRLQKSHMLFLGAMTEKLNETAQGIRSVVEGALVRQQETSVVAEHHFARRQTGLAQLEECEQQVSRILGQWQHGGKKTGKANGNGGSEMGSAT